MQPVRWEPSKQVQSEQLQKCVLAIPSSFQTYGQSAKEAPGVQGVCPKRVPSKFTSRASTGHVRNTEHGSGLLGSRTAARRSKQKSSESSGPGEAGPADGRPSPAACKGVESAPSCVEAALFQRRCPRFVGGQNLIR